MSDQRLTKQLIKLTRELIRFQSTKDSLDNKNAIINFAEKQFGNSNVWIKRYRQNRLPSLIINLKKEKNPKLFLVGHLDVVEADEKDFTPKIKGDKIYGRGSGDMKAACAVMIKVIKHWSKQEKKPSVGLILTTDEEIGGENGINYLLNRKGYKSQLAIIPDGGGANLSKITTHEKGAFHLRIFTTGKSAHGSRPFLGENAIDKLIKIYQKIRKKIPKLKKPQWKNTMNLGKINGGEATNKVPDHAEMWIDIRFSKIEDKTRIIQEIKKITTNFEIIAQGHPTIQDKNNVYIKEYKKIAQSILNKKIFFDRQEGGSDARFFSQKRIPVIITKLKSGNPHSKNEWVDIGEMKCFYKILIKFINTSKF